MTQESSKLVLLLAWVAILGCSGSSAEDGRTVEVGPLSCIMMGEDSSITLTSLSCKVTVGDAEASTEGIDVSVTNVLQVNVLPNVCRSFSQAEALAAPTEFVDAVKDGLRSEYARSGIGWSIQSVECQLSPI